jgi:hypothetical protein
VGSVDLTGTDRRSSCCTSRTVGKETRVIIIRWEFSVILVLLDLADPYVVKRDGCVWFVVWGGGGGGTASVNWEM